VGKTFAQAQEITDEFVDLMQSKGKKTGDEATLEDAVALAGVSQYPARIKCALLGWMAIKDASIQTQTK
jgi:nitrogen fixation NifU-like protein